MTCEDNCLHYEVCLIAFSSKGMYLGDDAEKMECFKNKADFVEVVRCKDCPYYEPNPYNKEEMVCRCYADWSFPEPNDFCSYGERKEE